MTNDEKYLAACAEYAALPPIETDEEKAHADALLRFIETYQGRQELLDHLRSLKVDLPVDWTFDRDEANAR